MGKTKKAPAASKTQEVLVNVVLDRSGSMSGSRDGTISGYNEYLNGLKADSDTKYNVSLIQFDSPSGGPELTVSYTDKPLADVPLLNAETYEPRGMTPLYDAVGECIRRVTANGRAVLTVIITDGLENASREFTKSAIKDLIKQKEAEGWKFVFLGANIDSAAVGGSMGVAAAACANYAPGQEKQLYGTMAAATMRYAGAVRNYGMRSIQARAAAAPTARERSAMMGGRPAAPPRFPKPTTQKPRTQWAIHG